MSDEKKERPIYLDNAATTPVDPEVLEAMKPYFLEEFGNPASTTHIYGQKAKEAVEKAKETIGELLNGDPEGFIFTSGATESINLALKGYFEANQDKGKHIITCKTEHKAVLDTCEYLETIGADVTYLGVDHAGRLDLKELENAIREDTLMIVIMYANNETGVLHPVEEIGKIAARNKVPFFCDATQAVGKVEVDIKGKGMKMMALSAHKFNGPKGVGALYVEKGVSLEPQIHGGGHQGGLRSGTMNVPGIMGMEKAILLMEQKRKETDFKHIKEARETLESKLKTSFSIKINGEGARRLPNILNVKFLNLPNGKGLENFKRDYAVSMGSACTSERIENSHVIQAMSQEDKDLKDSIRFSW
ncbi:MAG: cysteine desulfurase family protein [Flavobacteriales bacterium]